MFACLIEYVYVWRGMAWHGMAWNGMISHGAVYGETWYDMDHVYGVCVHEHVCMCDVCSYRKHASMHICMYACRHLYMYACMHACRHVSMHLCTYALTYVVGMHVRTYLNTFVCMCADVYCSTYK